MWWFGRRRISGISRRNERSRYEDEGGDENDEPAMIETDGEDALIGLAELVERGRGPVCVAAPRAAHEL